LDNGCVYPTKFQSLGFGDEFAALTREQFFLYNHIYETIVADGYRFASSSGKKAVQALENAAKEDARYVTSLATCSQLGMTINARNLNKLIDRLYGHPLEEAQQVGKKLEELMRKVTPSLVRVHRESHVSDAEFVIQNVLDSRIVLKSTCDAYLVAVTPSSDQLLAKVVASLFTPISPAAHVYPSLGDSDSEKIIFSRLKHLEKHDAVPREFELIQYIFDVKVSAACYGQLKRHRMATIIPKKYDLCLGCELPRSFKDIDGIAKFEELRCKTEDLYNKVERWDPHLAEYVLMQAHRRRVIISMNLRELYHFTRLRMDNHAQWEIRQLATEMADIAQAESPVSAMLLGGKDQFDDIYKHFFELTSSSESE
jgi:thymidylate synthase ThyX